MPQVCAGLEKRLKEIKGEVNDAHVKPGDCTALPMAEGMVFEVRCRGWPHSRTRSGSHGGACGCRFGVSHAARVAKSNRPCT